MEHDLNRLDDTSGEKLKEEYLDMYEGIQSEILSTTRVDENSGELRKSRYN